MPLLIDLKPGEKVIINGAVIENAGSNTKLRIHNESNILRQKEIVSETEMTTPASRVYLALQCAYIFPEKKEKYIALYDQFLTEYLEACPSAEQIVTEIREEVASDRFYKALKSSRRLLKHESAILDAHLETSEILADVVSVEEQAP